MKHIFEPQMKDQIEEILAVTTQLKQLRKESLKKNFFFFFFFAFFQAFFSQLLKLRSNCEDLSSIWVLYLFVISTL